MRKQTYIAKKLRVMCEGKPKPKNPKYNRVKLLMNVIAEENGSPQLTSLVNFIIDTSDLSAEQMTYTDTTQLLEPFIRHNVTAPNRPVIRVANRLFAQDLLNMAGSKRSHNPESRSSTEKTKHSESEEWKDEGLDHKNQHSALPGNNFTLLHYHSVDNFRMNKFN